jgi:hypothetical protein
MDKLLRNALAEDPPAAVNYAGKDSLLSDEAIKKKYIAKNQRKGDGQITGTLFWCSQVKQSLPRAMGYHAYSPTNL